MRGNPVPDPLNRWYAVKLFERDDRVQEALGLSQSVLDDVEQIVAACEAELDDDAESIITNQRYAFIARLVSACVRRGRPRGSLTVSDKIDRIVTNRWLALPIFAAVMWLVYSLSVTTVGAFATDFTNNVLVSEWIQAPAAAWLTSVGCAEWLVGLICDGVIGGVGAVIGFVPQMLVLFFLLALLEDAGYLARVAFIMDRLFRRFGLSGKSFIPMLIASGCGVPGVMASRTIEQERDRRMTVMTATFIPCGAKMPVVGLIAGALFSNAAWVAVSAYFIGVAAVAVSGILLKKTRLFAGDPAPFVMELPAYHIPSRRNVLSAAWERGWSFIKRAGSVILLSSMLIWFASGYGWPAAAQSPESAEAAPAFGAVENMDDSLLGRLGSLAAPVFRPLGFGGWQPTVATVMGLAAKEEVVSVFGVLYGLGEDAQGGSPVAASFEAISGGHGALAAFAFLLFNLLCAPCFAAIGAIRREMNSARWTWFAVGYQCAFAYAVALMVYQLGLLAGGAGFTPWTLTALTALAGLVFLLVRPNPRRRTRLSQSSHI